MQREKKKKSGEKKELGFLYQFEPYPQQIPSNSSKAASCLGRLHHAGLIASQFEPHRQQKPLLEIADLITQLILILIVLWIHLKLIFPGFDVRWIHKMSAVIDLVLFEFDSSLDLVLLVINRHIILCGLIIENSNSPNPSCLNKYDFISDGFDGTYRLFHDYFRDPLFYNCWYFYFPHTLKQLVILSNVLRCFRWV